MAANPPKQISSRLLTMKFMQRSAAKAVASPSASPSTPTGPPSKRMRMSTGGASTPGTPSDYEIIQAALAAEEKAREEAVEKQAAAAGETKWEFSYIEPNLPQNPSALQIVEAGWAELDQSDSEYEKRPIGRMTFGKFTSKAATSARAADADSDSDSSQSEGDDEDDPTDMLIREEKKKAKKRSDFSTPNSKSRQGHDPDNLDDITWISGGKPAETNIVKCFRCGMSGHMKQNCPNGRPGGGGGRRGGGGRGRGRLRF